MKNIRKQLNENNNGRLVFDIKIQNGMMNSFFSNGTKYFDDMALEIMNQASNYKCIDLVGHSQGGFFGRAYIQLKSGRNGHPSVRKFISVSGVQNGYYCQKKNNSFISYCKYLKLVTQTIDMYSNYVQKHITFASYWKDPYRYNDYKKTCNLLARINNECLQEMDNGKHYIEQLQYFIVLHTENDIVLSPLTTSQFDQFWQNSSKVQSFEETELYKQDKIGIRKLQSTNKYIELSINQYSHASSVAWKAKKFYNGCLKKLLELKDGQYVNSELCTE